MERAWCVCVHTACLHTDACTHTHTKHAHTRTHTCTFTTHTHVCKYTFCTYILTLHDHWKEWSTGTVAGSGQELGSDVGYFELERLAQSQDSLHQCWLVGILRTNSHKFVWDGKNIFSFLVKLRVSSNYLTKFYMLAVYQLWRISCRPGTAAKEWENYIYIYNFYNIFNFEIVYKHK